MGKLVDLTGQRFGKLTVIERAGTAPDRHAQWLCKCDCGAVRIIRGNELKNGNTVSCGCWRSERIANENEKHGYRKRDNTERLYQVWRSMIARCTNPSNKDYAHYGGRGISVCEEWRNYAEFRKWAILAGYDKDAKFFDCTIDRIDVNGDYCPTNCRWVDIKTQAQNKRPRMMGEEHG